MTRPGWTVRTVADGDEAGAVAAELVADALRDRLADADRATLALSGGSTPVPMLRALAADATVAWERVDVLQVDERAVPDGDDDRNLTMLRAELLDHVAARVHPLQVQHEGGLGAGAAASAAELSVVLGEDQRVDVLHLGLGGDGHTASLFPGDPVLAVDDDLVAATEEQGGNRRMTLTRPVLVAARTTVMLVVGDDKADALRRTLDADRSVPAGALDLTSVTVVTDLEVG